MIHKLEKDTYARVRPLFGDMVSYHVNIDAVLEGHNPGLVFADDPEQPEVALLIGPEGTCLGGTPPTEAQVQALKDQIPHLMHNHDLDALWLDCSPSWKAYLTDVFPWSPIRLPRQHYLCRALALDWRNHVPDGFSVQPITQELLERPELDIPEHVNDWMADNWGSVETFLARAFGFVSIDEAHSRIVSWSLCDCIGGDACEIGIHTGDAYRRRGLAAITAAAAVDHALTKGFRAVGWHCNTDNVGSRRTALKVGFLWERDYTHYIFLSSEAVHWAEAGRIEELHGNYREAAALYARANTAGDQPPWARYIPFYAACAFARHGDTQAALDWLNRAVERGFDDIDSLEDSDALAALKALPQWVALVQKIKHAG